MSTPTIPPFDPDVAPPRWSVGVGGWDTHAHVFGPADRFPYAADRAYTPPDATPADYLHVLDTLGLAHGVLVAPSCYGSDNTRLLDALAAHPDRFVGVVDLDVLATDAADADLAAMTGVRGLRLRWPAVTDRFDAVLDRLAALGWHADVLLEHCSAVPDLIECVTGSGVSVVVEAMGSPHADDGVDEPGFAALREWLGAGEGWVKLSHPYAIDGPGSYPNAARFARALVEAAPDRAVWGSDWPHPMRTGPVPRDGDLLDLLPQWVGGEALARAVLTDNPTAFYGPVRAAAAATPGR